MTGEALLHQGRVWTQSALDAALQLIVTGNHGEPDRRLTREQSRALRSCVEVWLKLIPAGVRRHVSFHLDGPWNADVMKTFLRRLNTAGVVDDAANSVADTALVRCSRITVGAPAEKPIDAYATPPSMRFQETLDELGLARVDFIGGQRAARSAGAQNGHWSEVSVVSGESGKLPEEGAVWIDPALYGGPGSVDSGISTSNVIFVKRDDGTMQLLLHGEPLHRWSAANVFAQWSGLLRGIVAAAAASGCQIASARARELAEEQANPLLDKVSEVFCRRAAHILNLVDPGYTVEQSASKPAPLVTAWQQRPHPLPAIANKEPAAQQEPKAEAAPKIAVISTGTIHRHLLTVGNAAAGKTTFLATGLRRLQLLGVYHSMETEQAAAKEVKSTNGYPLYQCAVPPRSARHVKGRFRFLGGFSQDIWHDCDGFSFSGDGVAPATAEPLMEAAKQAERVLYITPASNVLTEDGKLNQTWLDELRRFGACARRGHRGTGRLTGWHRQRALVLTKVEVDRSPGLSRERLGNLLGLLRKEPVLTAHYSAAFLTRATTDSMHETALQQQSWAGCVREWTEAGAFLPQLRTIGFADQNLTLSSAALGEETPAFEPAVPLAWAAGFIKGKQLQAYPDCFADLRSA